MKVHFKDYELLDGSRKRLVERVGDGSIIKRFDMTPVPKLPEDIVCPHFLELKWATGCPYDCAWCYLKGTLRMLPYKTKPKFKDLGKIMTHVDEFLRSNSPPEILNSGEIADSLMGEHLKLPFSEFIVSMFEGTKHKVLFLTKSNNVKVLTDLYEWNINNPIKSIIMSWSINADPVARRWEKGAPPVKDRIEAARKVAEAGYEVRIRIDPIISGFVTEYRDLIDQLLDNLTPSRITLGSLRGLQSTINAAKDKSWIPYLSEKSNWGLRAPFSTRLTMYPAIISHLRDTKGYRGPIALCKETREIWHQLHMNLEKCLCNCTW